jgi:hypothetical protein
VEKKKLLATRMNYGSIKGSGGKRPTADCGPVGCGARLVTDRGVRGVSGRRFPRNLGSKRSGLQKLRLPSYTRVIAKISLNQETPWAPVAAPKGMRTRAEPKIMTFRRQARYFC